MREELAWAKSNLLFALYLSKLQSRLKIFTDVYKWETGTAHHLSRRGKFRIVFLNSQSCYKANKNGQGTSPVSRAENMTSKRRDTYWLQFKASGIRQALGFEGNPGHAGLMMCVYTSTTSCHFSSLPPIFAMAHTYNRALFRDDIMWCFEKKKNGVKVFFSSCQWEMCLMCFSKLLPWGRKSSL